MPRASKAVDAVKNLGRKVAAGGTDKSTTKVAAKQTKAAPKAATTAKKSPKVTKNVKKTVPVKADVPAAAKKDPSAGSKPPAAKKAGKPSKRSTETPVEKAAEKAPKASKASKASKPAKRLEGAGADKFFEEQRALLMDERITYLAQAADLKAEADQLAQEMEPGDIQFDDESGEGATAAVDRERDLALSAQARLEVDEIDHALAKLEGGSYGICEACGQPVPRARLKALPHARLCVACKSGGLSRR